MHSTSTLYETIKSGLHTVRVILEIETLTNGTTEYVELDESKIYSLKTSGSVFPDEKPSIGNFCAREIDTIFEPPTGKTIPKQARMRIFTYLDNGTQQSERIQKGVFFVDTREYNADKTKMIVHGYDAAVKFDSDFDSIDISWPSEASYAVFKIAQSVGVPVGNTVSSIVTASKYRTVPLLTNVTKREYLCAVACQFCSNFYIDDMGRLQMLLLNTGGGDVAVYYLSDENGNYITIGGDRIIV